MHYVTLPRFFGRVFRQTSRLRHTATYHFVVIYYCPVANAFFLRVPPHTTGTQRWYGSRNPALSHPVVFCKTSLGLTNCLGASYYKVCVTLQYLYNAGYV